ncbi:MAG: hypothetical protein O7E54_02985, partial [Planctomycetota bacterium]|nr:hypothetical protein [Planctomycetota bacterium]
AKFMVAVSRANKKIPKDETIDWGQSVIGQIWEHRIKLKKTRQHIEQKPNMFRRGGALPIGIVIPPDGEHAFVACGGYDQLAVIHLNSFKVVGMIATGREPDGLAYSALSLRDAREPNPR